MAKKKSFRDLYNTWSEQEARRVAASDEAEQNKLAKIGAVLSALEAEGADPATLKAVSDQMYATGEFNTDTPALPQEQTPVLPSDKPMPQMSATTSQDVFDQLTTDPRQLVSDAGATFRAGAREGLAGLLTGPVDVINASINSPTNQALAAKLGIRLPQMRNPKLLVEESARLRDEAARIRGEETSVRSRLGREVVADAEGFTGTLEAYATNPTILADELAAQAGQMYGSAPGAVAGPGGLVGAQAVAAAGQQGEAAAADVAAKGGSQEEQDRARNLAAGVSFVANAAIPAITPGGTALERLVTGAATDVGRRSVVGAATVPLAAETVSEMLSEVLDQTGFNVATGRPASEGLGKAAAAGLAVGVAMGGAPAVADALEAGAGQRRRAADTEAEILAGADRARSNAIVLPDEAPVAVNAAQSANYSAQDVAAREAANPNIDRELFNVEQDIAADAAKRKALDDAFNQREEEQALQQAVEEEAGFRTIANQQNSQGTMADALRGAGVTTEVTPAQVAAEVVQADKEKKAEAKREAGRKAAEEAASARVRVINDVNRLRATVEKEAADKTKKEQAAATSQRTATIKQLIRDNPKATDAEIADMLPAALAKKQETKVDEDPTLKKITSIRNSIEGQKKKKLAESENKRLTALVKRNPNATPAQIKEMFEGQAKTETSTPEAKKTAPDIEKLKTSSDPLDRAQAEALSRLGMSGNKTAKTSADFGDKVRKVARALATDSSGRAAAAERLIRQGKLVIVPNADHTGGERTKRPGEYDPETGTTYIYTDNIEGDNIAEVMEAASHESGHLGQFNERDQRPERMKALLGRGITDASKVLRKAARNGNKFAQEALRRAEEDTEQRRKDGQENPGRYENEELVAYAIGQENAGRTSILGSAGGAIRDVVAGAKEQLRKRLGVNLKITANDVRSAMANMLQEATETDTNSSKGDRLGMIYNKNSKGFDEAVANGWVYDSVDGDKKYVLSDADSKIKPGAAQKLAKSTSPIRLADILEHPVLFKEHPEAANIPVIAVDSLGKGVFGTYDSSDQSIYVTRELAERTDPYKTSLREALMHEIQHFVQDVGGYAKRFYSGKDRDPTVVKARAELKKAERSNDLAAATLLTNATRLTPNRDDKMAVATVVRGEGSDHRKATQLVDLFKDMEVSPELQAFIDDFNITKQNYNEKATAANVAAELAFANYQANITEREAFRTQYDVDAPESEIRARGNPEAMMRTQEEMDGVDPTGGRIDVPTVAGTVEARAERLGMAGNTSTPAFKKWFGDSVVTDSEGDPQVVYTGTSKDVDFKSFKMPKNGVWFSTDPKVASAYALDNDSKDVKYQGGRFVDVNTSSRVFPVYLSIQNPYTITDADFKQMNVQNYKKAQGVFFDKLRAQGYDGAVFGGGTYVVIGEPSQIKSVNNSGNFNPKSKDVLGMAGNSDKGKKAALRNKNKATTFLMSAIRNDKGLGAHIRDEVELAKAAPVEFESKANKAAGQYDAAIKRMAAEKGTTPEKLNAEIRDKLEAIAEMEDTASEYKAEFDKIADQYGKAGAALKRLRQAVDDLSVELLKTYLDSGVKLTNKEKNDLKKVANNLGRYVHRFYASRLGRGLGEQYSRAVQDAVDKARAKGKGSLTPKEQELNDRYVNAAKTVLDGVMIPSEEDIGSLLESQVDYLYDTWFGTDTTGMTREDKESALLERREEIGPDDLQEKTDAALQALLWSAKESAATRYYDRGEKLDTTIMQERSRIPKEIRALMGEVTGPAAALVNTVSKQAEYVARTKLMFALRNMASPQDLQPPGSAGNAAVRNNNMVELKGEAYGPLNGYFASPSLRAMIDDTAESLQNFTEAMTTGTQQYEGAITAAARGTAKAWMKGASGAKAVNIVGNAFRYPLNFLGSFGMLGLNGNINVKSWGRGFTDAADIIRYAAKPSAGLGGAELASKYRVVDSATVGDLKQLDLGKIEQVVREMSGKSPGALMRKARELGMAGRELYAMMDVWSKIANFHAEVDFLKSMYKAEGIDKSDDAIYREAAAIVNNTNMSYARTAPFIKAIERAGITQYGPYMYEAHRVVLTNIMQGLHELYRAKDMKTAKGKALMAARGTARLAGTAGVLSMIGTLSHFAAGMWGDDEEDKRALLPEYARIMDFLNVGKDEDGNPILYGVSNVDPLGPITDLYRAARIGDQPAEAVWNQFKENYVAPSLGGALWDVAARTTGWVPPTSSRPRKPLVAQWTPDGWSKAMSVTGNEDMWSSIAHFVETRYMPGTPRAWSESNPIAAGGSMNEVAYNIARGMGARGLRYSPQVGTVDAAFTYDDTMKALRRDLAAYVENTTNPSEEEVLGRLLEMRIEEKRAWDQLARVRRGMLAVGMSEEEADAELKLARVPKEVIEQLAEEDYQSRVISETSISSAAKTQIRKAKTEKQKEEVQAKWEAAWEILGEIE